MMYTRESLITLIKQDLVGKPELEKFLIEILKDNDLESIDIPNLSEDVCYELNQCLAAPDLPNPKFSWKP